MISALVLFAQVATAVPSDTPPPSPARRVQAVEVSDWYSRRLTLHRRLSYTVIPLFAFQYAAGQQLWEKGTGGAPEGVLAAAALRCVGGQMQGRLIIDTDEKRDRECEQDRPPDAVRSQHILGRLRLDTRRVRRQHGTDGE